MEKIMIDNMLMDAGCWELFGVNILLVKAGHGALGCGYINLDAAEKFNHALAIVNGVSNYAQMLTADVKAVSSAAAALGVQVGMSGKEALQKMA